MGWLDGEVVDQWTDTGTVHDVRYALHRSFFSRGAMYQQITCRFVPDSVPGTSFKSRSAATPRSRASWSAMEPWPESPWPMAMSSWEEQRCSISSLRPEECAHVFQ